MKTLLQHPRSFSQSTAQTALLCLLGLTTQVALAQPFNIDTSSRETVRIFYNTVYQASEGVPINWTGNIATCNPGTVSPAYLDATLRRINYFRAMAGVPSNIIFTDSNNIMVQATAMMMSANRDIDHEPPVTWTCYTQQARDGASANLNIGSTGPKAIDSFMHDGGDNNARAGHRRSTLFAGQLTMASGNVPATATGNFPSTATLWVHAPKAPQRPPVRDDFVAWPPKGFVPYQTVYPRWSFDLENADFTAATVTMQRNGANVPVLVNSRETTFEPGIVWIPNNLNNDADWPRPTADETYTVNIINVVVNGTPQNFTYNVTIIDPIVPGPDYAPPVVTGPDAPLLNQDTAYNFTAVLNATAYQWRSTKLTPLNLTDGAEAGLVNFTTNVGAYNPVVTDVKASGNQGFNLRQPGGDFNPQSLRFNRTLQVNDNSQITFKSRFVLASSLAARVEVSIDDGQTWTAVFTQNGTEAGEAAFSDKVVPLAAYAGGQIQIRFNLVYTGGPKFTGGNPLHWYFDDITFVNLSEASAPVVNNVPAGTTFAFHPTEQSAFGLNARPQFFGQYFGDWGPTKLVSTATTTPTAPTITTQPQGQTVNPGANVTFTVVAQGTAPFKYGWRYNGGPMADGPNVQGSASNILTLLNVQAPQAGAYTVGVTNAVGDTLSTPPAMLVVNEAPSLATALDTTGLNWTTSGNANWIVQTAVTHDGVDAAKSGTIADNQQSLMETTIAGPATVAFWWRIESELNYDFLSVELDGTMQFRISGTVNWETKTVAVPAGNHTLRWKYLKDGSVSTGADAGWVDQVNVQQAQPPPTLADALDTTNVVWATAGNLPWFSQIATTHDGTDAVQSGPVVDSQESRLEANILGPANLSFWWKVDSEPTYDFLIFELDGNQPFPPITGNVDWQQKTVPIPAGTHAVKWTYRKDFSVSVGADAGWVDQVVLTKLTPGEGGEAGPLLQHSASGTKLRIAWPEVAIGFKLQVATSFNPPDWQDVPENDISKEEGEFFIIVDTTVGTKFFQLVEVP